MKWVLILLLGLSYTGFNTASAACSPHKCPLPPSDPLRPIPIPGPPSKVKVIGYYEVASPECTEEAYALAVAAAEEKATQEAYMRLQTDQITMLKPFWYSTHCGQSIYAGSFKGNSWIVQAFGEFGR